ncbi:MAG TPA: hypothetical protein VG148_08705 [Pyrinomonadaceae bacterium]|nr:hypothetical protein [Pyrinomonadaceae bacterium]
MGTIIFSMSLLLGTVAAFAQQTADNERTGWYASNPWTIAALVLPLVALVAIGAFLLLRRKL